jgi:predicted transcriptional regulator
VLIHGKTVLLDLQIQKTCGTLYRLRKFSRLITATGAAIAASGVVTIILMFAIVTAPILTSTVMTVTTVTVLVITRS